MLDPKFILENLETFETKSKLKGFSFDPITYKKTYEDRLSLLQRVEKLRSQRNDYSFKVSQEKDPTQKKTLISEVQTINQELKSLEVSLRDIEEVFSKILLSVPNLPSDDTPEGKTEADNPIIKTWRSPTQFDFPFLNHIDLIQKWDIVDFQRATLISGSRGYALKTWGFILERAIFSLALDLLRQRNFQILHVPILVKREAMEGTGYLPLGADDAYQFEKDDLRLVGTAEVSLMAFYQNTQFTEAELPLRVCAVTPCFRREAGAHGKDTKGLYRVHQFQKCEQVVICPPHKETSDKLQEEILGNSEALLQALELPYRVVQACTGELGFGQVRKFDIETWMPSRENYGETHSCSAFYDFQARRLKMKFQGEYCYSLNNTLVASPRILIPFLENHQQQDHTLKIPSALKPYLPQEYPSWMK